MAKVWKTNSTSGVKVIDGRLVEPGNGVFVDEPDAVAKDLPIAGRKLPGGALVLDVGGEQRGTMSVAGAAAAEALVSKYGSTDAQLSADISVVAAAKNIRAKFPLKSSVVGTVYQGSESTVAFGRNNAGSNGFTTVRDHQGYLNYCRTDEAPFKGARRVENLVQDSVTFGTGWQVEGSTQMVDTASGVGKRFNRATASTGMLTLSNMTLETGVHVMAFDVWTESGTATLRIRIERADTTQVAERDISISTTSKRIALAGLVPDVAQQTKVLIGITTGSSVHFCASQPQFERKANGEPHPSEYVSRGAAGAVWPYHGACVDGVKYFETLNPCFLETSGTVRTDVTPGGVPIDEDVMKGILRPPIAIQRFLYSSAFDNAAWTKTGVTATQVAALANPVGYGRAYRLDETAVTSVMTVSEAWSGAIAADNLNLAVSFFFKRNVGRDWVRVGLVNKANVTDQIWFNIATLTVGTITSGTGTITADEVTWEVYPNGWVRVGFGGASAGSGATTPSGFAGIADNDGNSSYLGVVGNSVYIAAGQLEQADHPTAYIGNSAATVLQRSGETTLEVPSTLNVPNNNFTIGLEFTPSYRTNSKRKSDFYYIAYSRVDANNRWGTALRPGIFGGNALDRDARGWAQDFYANAATFGGVNITLGLVAQPFQTVRQFFGHQSSARQAGGDGSFMCVDGIVAYSTETATPTTADIVNKQTYMRLGSSLITGKHDACYKNLVILDRALEDEELEYAGSYA